MSKVRITCPKCNEKFTALESDLYECPKCGTNVRPKNKSVDMDKTQTFKI